jgi:hypothetical protein
MTRLFRIVATTAGLALVLAALTASPTAAFAAGKGQNAPSLSVLGFGVNQLFVPKGTTVKSQSKCGDIVGSSSMIGPPQQVYLTVYVRATGIPNKAPTQIKDTLPYGYDEVASAEFTPPAPFSNAFGAGILPFGAPPGSTKDLFHTLIVSFASEAGTYEGPSSEEFDGEYSYTVSVKAKGRTLTSTAKVTVDCPMLR